jgi:hypothetical protein
MARKSLLITLAALFAIAADAAQVTHVNLSGDFADAAWSPDASSFVDIVASRSGSSTFLFVFAESTDPTTGNFTVLNGQGFVPDANLYVNTGKVTATINTELANDPGFTLTSTVYDQFGNFISQTTISSGSINITLRKNRLFSLSLVGVQSNTIANVTYRQEANQSSQSASGTGSFLGSAVPSDALGDIGTNRSNFITIIKN